LLLKINYGLEWPKKQHTNGHRSLTLIGWVGDIKGENVEIYHHGIEKDIERLQTITERFSKIGFKNLF
jgi:hypothetical protein